MVDLVLSASGNISVCYSTEKIRKMDFYDCFSLLWYTGKKFYIFYRAESYYMEIVIAWIQAKA